MLMSSIVFDIPQTIWLFGHLESVIPFSCSRSTVRHRNDHYASTALSPGVPLMTRQMQQVGLASAFRGIDILHAPAWNCSSSGTNATFLGLDLAWIKRPSCHHALLRALLGNQCSSIQPPPNRPIVHHNMLLRLTPSTLLLMRAQSLMVIVAAPFVS
jgi:hypothetical protein